MRFARLIANHLHLAIFESTPEVRVLPSADITQLQRSYDPVRLPPEPSPNRDVEAATLARDGSPPITRITLPTCRAHYPRGSSWCSCRLLPAQAAFPKWQEGRHPHCHFRGLLRLHSRYGPPDRSAALGDLCHKAPARAVTRTSRSSANRINRQLSGWNLPPLVIRAFGAHCQLLTHAVQQTAPLFGHRVGTGELPWRCKAVSGGLRRQRQRSFFGTSRGNGLPEAQRWHAGAEGSLAQISGVCLSCIRYRVTAKSTRRI